MMPSNDFPGGNLIYCHRGKMEKKGLWGERAHQHFKQEHLCHWRCRRDPIIEESFFFISLILPPSIASILSIIFFRSLILSLSFPLFCSSSSPPLSHSDILHSGRIKEGLVEKYGLQVWFNNAHNFMNANQTKNYFNLSKRKWKETNSVCNVWPWQQCPVAFPP